MLDLPELIQIEAKKRAWCRLAEGLMHNVMCEFEAKSGPARGSWDFKVLQNLFR